jgi:hypothetical protein
MVIGERFSWAHIPKTGGTATLNMFWLFPDLVEFADPIDSDGQHLTFRDRWDRSEGKLLLLNLRRLPTWVLSRAHHVSRLGVSPGFERKPVPPPDELARSSLPDERLSLYTDSGGLRIDRWFRMESLTDDFLSFVSELRDVDELERRHVTELGAMNALDYDHELAGWFDRGQLETLYGNNPVWRDLEQRLYGGLQLLD